MSRISATVSVNVANLPDRFVRVSQGLINGVKEAAAIVEADAKRMCPAGRTGDLKKSIHTEGPIKGIGQMMAQPSGSESECTVSARVLPDTDYAEFVEYGTGIRGVGTYPYELPQEGVPFTGSWVYDYKRQNWQGHAAQPYMRPAADNNRDTVVDAIVDAVRAALT
jgi:HK97 gp10 family phage protein